MFKPDVFFFVAVVVVDFSLNSICSFLHLFFFLGGGGRTEVSQKIVVVEVTFQINRGNE